MNKYILFFICCLSVYLVGCSGKVSVEGTVTYPDGTPLTLGTVIFERENYQVAGQIDANGHYRLGEIHSGDGVLPGTYAVRVSAQTGGTSDGESIVKYVAEKYENTATSGLTCEVNRSRRFDFTVEPFSE